MKEQFDLELFPVMPEEHEPEEIELVAEVPCEDLSREELLKEIQGWEKAYNGAMEQVEMGRKNYDSLFATYQSAYKDFNENMDRADAVIQALGRFHENRLNAFNGIIDNARLLMKGFELPPIPKEEENNV